MYSAKYVFDLIKLSIFQYCLLWRLVVYNLQPFSIFALKARSKIWLIYVLWQLPVKQNLVEASWDIFCIQLETFVEMLVNKIWFNTCIHLKQTLNLTTVDDIPSKNISHIYDNSQLPPAAKKLWKNILSLTIFDSTANRGQSATVFVQGTHQLPEKLKLDKSSLRQNEACRGEISKHWANIIFSSTTGIYFLCWLWAWLFVMNILCWERCGALPGWSVCNISL